MNRQPRAETAASIALAGVSTWVVIVVILHLVPHDDYDLVAQSISQLAHESYGFLINLGLIALGIGGLALALGAYSALGRKLTVPLLLAVSSVLWIIAGVFNTGTGDPVAFQADEPALTELIHDIGVLISLVLVLISMLVVVWQARALQGWTRFIRFNVVWVVIFVVTFAVYPMLGDDRFGVSQRIQIGALVIWLVVLAIHVRSASVSDEQATARAS